MPTCEKCPREVAEGETLCKHHRVEKQKKRKDTAETAGGIGKAILAVVPAVLGFLALILSKKK